ncbi:hypothetical protein HMN09_00251200 [Mycena chlorophos]|uniref:Uncharacterized protein n=1 Tax=Mycena chlorophos TaxID=658473 RepID=A0A8H6TK01_MYCCL|nr:hypothetical protein HMN09_00251200 [Mycena chlorophos]
MGANRRTRSTERDTCGLEENRDLTKSSRVISLLGANAMDDAEAIRAISTFRIRIDAANAKTRAMSYNLASYSADPLLSLAAINDQMNDQTATQQAHFDMEMRLAKKASPADLQARIAGLKERRLVLLQKLKQQSEEEDEPGLNETPAQQSVGEKRKREWDEATRTAPTRSNPKRSPTKTAASETPAAGPTPAAGSTHLPPPTGAIVPTTLPPPPDGFASWTAVYAQPQIQVLAKAQSREDLKTTPRQSEGLVIVPSHPCSGCVRLKVPCLLIEGRGSKVCLVCQTATRHEACIANITAQPHPYADAVAQYHNYTVSIGQRPGAWMGPDAASGPMPKPPPGFDSWTDVYKSSPNMLKLASAQARLDLSDEALPGRVKLGVYGKVKIPAKPCKHCLFSDVPCLSVDSTVMRRCLMCQVYRAPRNVGGKCVAASEDEEQSETHPWARAIVRYHNHAIALNERPGMWMGPGVPQLEVDSPIRTWSQPKAMVASTGPTTRAHRVGTAGGSAGVSDEDEEEEPKAKRTRR